MVAIYADFNARTASDRIRLDPAGSIESLRENPVREGDWLWLSDNDLRVGAQIERQGNEYLARPAWETLEDIAAAGQMNPAELQAGVARLRELLEAPEKDYKRILRLLPVAERVLPNKGFAAYQRSRAMHAFGYPGLALAAVEDALGLEPNHPGFLHHKLQLLSELDLDRAVHEAERLVALDTTPAIVLVGCAQVLALEARRTQSEAAKELDRRIISLADRIEASQDVGTLPPSARSLALTLRGFAHSHLGEKEPAVSAFNKAVEAYPLSPGALACRGMEAYPSRQALVDLENSVKLGILSSWPSYLLAHASLTRRDWQALTRHAQAALRFEPPAGRAADLYEWLGIAEVESGGSLTVAVRWIERAVDLALDVVRVRRNLQLAKQLAGASRQSASPAWEMQKQVQAAAADLQRSAA